jgi:elongator complex protein 1
MKTGVNSFSVNVSMGILLYATVGTRPHLHFCSLDAISNLDPLRFENNAPLPIETAAPRPLERGARLVVTVANQPKVVIQLPRGNLEGFEPRPLVLAHACRLLDNGEYLKCLVLLRRQKVDLNFIVDYNPQKFLDHVEFVRDALSVGNDILSLFISSLEDYDSVALKYRMPTSGMVPERFRSDGKVNTICKVIRDVLILDFSEKPSALHPMLCTYAKSRPPQLLEALQLIKSLSSSSDTKDVNSSLQTQRIHGALKYLAFLAEGEKLFDGALESCDFYMARTVAKICQMDPKSYIPLIESFESIEKLGERSADANSVYSSAMRFRLFLHLKRVVEAVKYGVSTLAISSELLAKSESDPSMQEFIVLLLGDIIIDSIQDSLFTAISSSDEIPTVLSLLRPVATKMASLRNKFSRALNELLRNVQYLFGQRCIEKMNFSEAVTIFLSANPPNYKEAIRAARLMGDWPTAIAVANKASRTSSEINVLQIVQELVLDCREVLEQGEAFDDDLGLSLTSGNFDTAQGSVALATENDPQERAALAARLCVDYLDDIEGAVSILLAARKWMDAVSIAVLKKRFDLVQEDVR